MIIYHRLALDDVIILCNAESEIRNQISNRAEYGWMAGNYVLLHFNVICTYLALFNHHSLEMLMSSHCIICV